MRQLLLIGVMLFLGSQALADTLYLKNRSRLEGTITKETETTVTINVGGGAITVGRDEIVEIEKNPVQRYVFWDKKAPSTGSGAGLEPGRFGQAAIRGLVTSARAIRPGRFLLIRSVDALWQRVTPVKKPKKREPLTAERARAMGMSPREFIIRSAWEHWSSILFQPKGIFHYLLFLLWAALYGGLLTKLYVLWKRGYVPYYRAALFHLTIGVAAPLLFIVGGILIPEIIFIFLIFQVLPPNPIFYYTPLGLGFLTSLVVFTVLYFKLSLRWLYLRKLAAIGMILFMIGVNLATALVGELALRVVSLFT